MPPIWRLSFCAKLLSLRSLRTFVGVWRSCLVLAVSDCVSDCVPAGCGPPRHPCPEPHLGFAPASGAHFLSCGSDVARRNAEEPNRSRIWSAAVSKPACRCRSSWSIPGEDNVGVQDVVLTFKKGHRNHGAFSSYKDANPMTLQLILERRNGQTNGPALALFQSLSPTSGRSIWEWVD